MNLNTAIIDNVLERIECDTEVMTDLLQALVRTPSVCGESPERAVAELLAKAARAWGFSLEWVNADHDRPNLLIRYGSQHGPRLAFIGHMDTVPVGDPVRWKYPPFSAAIEDGRMYGRGAIDMKSGIVATLFALKAIADAEVRVEGEVVLVYVSDEESGARSAIGLRSLLESGTLAADGAIYAYPDTETILVGHRGYVRFCLVAMGESLHSGSLSWETKESGVNAVTGLAELLVRLEAIELDGIGEGAFRGRRPVITAGTLITGGTGISVVPDRCEAWVDIRTLPHQGGAGILRVVEGLISDVTRRRPGLRIEITQLSEIPGVEIAPGERVVTVLRRNAETVLGFSPELRGAGPANEGYLLVKAGIPTVCGFGPDGGNAHAVDEFVELRSIPQVAKVYALAALDFCGHE